MFDPDNFEEFKHKIIYIPVTDFPFPEEKATSTHEFWANEFHMRDVAIHAIRKIAGDHTIIISSDLDEVVKPDRIKTFDPNLYNMAMT